MQTTPQTTSPLTYHRSSQSASWRRRRCAAQLARVSARSSSVAHRHLLSATTRALASLSAALAPVALAVLFLLAGSLTSAPLAQTHAATLSSSAAATTAVDLAAVADMADMRAQTSAAVALRYQRGYSVQNGWLCYGWANGAYHCTQHWYRASSGLYVSRNPGWVPSQAASGVASAVGFSTLASGSSAVSATPLGLSQWAYTGRGAWNDSGLRGAYPAGQCTLYAWSRDTRLSGLGNAGNWAAAARGRGLAVGSSPRVGATVVFAGGVQGASGLGHVAHVEKVFAGGWFLVSEMNFSFNGGGWGRVDYRFAHSGGGVSFIYR